MRLINNQPVGTAEHQVPQELTKPKSSHHARKGVACAAGDTTRMQQALGDGANLQQHMQTAASLGAYAQQLRAQQTGGSVATSAAHGPPSSAAAPAAQHAQANGSARGAQGGSPRGGALPAPPRQHQSGGAHPSAPSSDPSNITSSSSLGGGFLPAQQHQPQGVTHQPPPGHHAWRVTSERQLQQGGGGGGVIAQALLPAADALPGGGLTARPGRQAAHHAMPATAPRFPIDYSPLPGVAAQASSHVAPRRFFGDPGSSEIQPADDPPGPPMRFLHPPGSYHGGHGSTLPQRRGETYAQVSR